jgi:hypothetical protein
MFTKKLQMLATTTMSNELKYFGYNNWIRGLEATNKFTTQGFFNATFDMWLHNATFWC